MHEIPHALPRHSTPRHANTARAWVIDQSSRAGISHAAAPPGRSTAAEKTGASGRDDAAAQSLNHATPGAAVFSSSSLSSFNDLYYFLYLFSYSVSTSFTIFFFFFF